ncbi:hypothetical protein HKBW3S06_00402 [Candidatus Hakubella thermalkaliphila]|uniref:Nucleotidyl transferase AbiEii toxin, Type IV TA system n=2 Tax=Candidatus Hakubella thermalkaliphila TaxID=2754717 RepID=A0A6V8NRW9_9ACTN|nr:nucleotidyl transferase AbiEii/AbiGii toxin family protein [Candidatus Hakubella thermalkaliphila]GFP21176.1 hypothetical protein HKBW3S06_00402 [Candidatus Hakubella thermalkaliphila]GFP41716.1 hypothetical protein HKBW3C_00842 [Candidatus Hakubella thermalkaliphila]
MPRLSGDYELEVTEASKSVLVELMTILKSYADALVLIGGWAPYFLLEKHKSPTSDFRHVGSVDIDLVIDPQIIDEERYATITKMLLDRGYRPSPQIFYQFERKIVSSLDQREYVVGVDFLTPKPEKGKGRKHRHRLVQPDLRARTLEGAEIALKHNWECSLSGILPEDGGTTVTLRVADIVSSLALKGIALGERYAEKDAYDIYVLLSYYRDGPRDVRDELKPYLSDKFLQKGLSSIESRFRSPEAEGPSWVANFLIQTNPELIKRTKMDAYMTVREFFEQLEQ